MNPDGTKKWEYSVSSINSPPLYSPSIGSDGTIYVGAGDGKLYALNPDGTKKWEYYANSYIPSNPAIGSDNTIYFGCANDKLYALNPDGTKKWEFGPVGDNIESSPAIASDGTIYFLSNDKKLYALESESSWIESDYQTSMQGYANSYWPKFRQNNFNLGRYYTSNLITQSISATPSTLVQGETITITMTISNNRNDTAANISPSNLFHSGTGGISYVSGPSPVSLTIDGHSQETFVWKYTAEINGSVIFTGNASGDNWTLIKPTDSNEVTIQTPASLSSSITASPSTVVQGNTITVTMTVSNSGDSTATTVVPSALGKTGTGSAAFASGPTPSSRTIAGHSEANFTWTYTAGDVGALTFSGNASADGGLSSSSTDSNEVTIYIPNGAPYVIENFDERGVKKSEIVIPYTLYDGESDICSLSVEYYYEGSWLPATEGVGGDGSVGLASSTTGVPHIFVWDSRSDTMQSILHKTKIRIKPNDGLLEGPWTETGIFNVNNKRPDPKVIFGPIATARLKAVKELLAIIEPKLPEISTDEIEKMMDEAYMHIENASNSNDEVYISSELNKAKKLLEKIEKILDSS
ncbi:MAG: outer membrane biogenesis protein BamB [Candidatus Methanofastidiosum methylothiophilum]|uniref:Outer membrane biogenesis protein BamB n=1 Tax=Candidatus Methanofastidiosum methylothiophilum TaxID=1705564 RepID=A0A150IJP9_9EURY|nr:MAG: outer membrane biogenesis protein BamB [Candidatus Methanofastidiosum methylthiophilus]